jgi:hypothetical protein
VDAILRANIVELKGKSPVSEREKEETHRRPIKEVKRESTDAEAVEENGKKLQGPDADSKHVEAAYNRQIKELGYRLIEKEKLEAILGGHIQELERKQQKRYAEKEQLVTAHYAKFKQLKKKKKKKMMMMMMMMETVGERATLEETFNRKIRELEEELQEAHSMKNEAESALCGQTEYYKRKMKAKDAVREQVEVAVFDSSKELEERVRASRKFEVFRRMCEDFNSRIREANSGKDVAISLMERFENEVRKKISRQGSYGNQPPL